MEASPRWRLAAALLFHNEARYLEEWVRYHLLVGVEHFWLYDDLSTDRWREVLEPWLDEGVVEVIPWPILEPTEYVPLQAAAYRDVLARARGRAEWLAIIDTDEFLLPLADDTVPAVLERNFPDAAAVYASWRNFGTGGVFLDREGPLLRRLTACSERSHPLNVTGKSIVRPDRVQIEKVWYAHHVVLEPGALYYDGDGNIIPQSERQPEIDGSTHDSLIRINHYGLRDETFFRTRKLPRIRSVPRPEAPYWAQYYAFSNETETTILDFLQNRHPAAYAAYWDRPAEDWPTLGPYVSARLQGGLGNRLFQVAAASALAWDNDAKAIFPDFDTSSPEYRHVFLRCGTGPDPGSWSDWNERSYAFSPVPYTDNVRLNGYFQSERYFAHQRERLLAELQPSVVLDEHISGGYGDLLALDTVAVQLRNYTQDDPNRDRYQQYGLAYLAKAANLFPPSSVFVVSSNDVEFARANIPAEMENFVLLGADEPDYVQFHVLARCKNAIISNSSFGWWAAWLNMNPKKRVVRPAGWVKDLPAEDVCPPEWVALDAPEVA